MVSCEEGDICQHTPSPVPNPTPNNDRNSHGGGTDGEHCNNDPDCELGRGHDEGGIGPAPILTFIGPAPSPTDDSFGDDLGGLGIFIRANKFLIDLIAFIGNYGTPAWRQWKGFGNYGFLLEGIAGAFLQGAQDFDDPSLTPWQKLSRAIVVGAEDAVTELLSEAISPFTVEIGAAAGADIGLAIGLVPGATAGGVVGAVAGYITGNIGTNVIMNAAWSRFNQWALPGLFP